MIRMTTPIVIIHQGADLATTAFRISRELSKIDMLKFEYSSVSRTFWLEYGTEPFFRTLEWTQHEPYHIKNETLVFAIKKAIEWFPHNKPDDPQYDWEEDTDDFPPPPPIPNSWFTASIRMRKSSIGDIWGTVIDLRQSTGDRATYCRVSRIIQEALSLQNILWRERVEFISLANGVEPNAESHIERYVFNELNVREICEFIG